MIQNKSLKIIGLTGGIATGKSTVTKILLDKGYTVIDADKIAREVVEIGRPAYNGIVEAFGTSILKKNATINRKKLADIIYIDEKSRLKLNGIVHYEVTLEILRQIEGYSGVKGVIFLDIPLLIEEHSRLNQFGLKLDAIWLVYANEEVQLKRLIERDQYSREDALKRMRAQMPIEDKKRYVDVIIDNSKDIKHLTITIDRLVESL